MFVVTRSLIRPNVLCRGVQAMQYSTPAGKIDLRHVAHRMQSSAAGGKFTMKIVPSRPEKTETYDEKNMRLSRELSPHLSIYKPQLTSLLSITLRASGLFTSFYVWAMGLGTLLSPHDIQHYITMMEGLDLSDMALSAMKFSIVFPFAYHTCAGVRHLVWDTGKFLSLKEIYGTGYAMLLSSVALAVILAVL